MIRQTAKSALKLGKKHILNTSVEFIIGDKGLELDTVNFKQYHEEDVTLADISFELFDDIRSFSRQSSGGFYGYSFQNVVLEILYETEYDEFGGYEYLLQEYWYVEKESGERTIITWEDMEVGASEREIIKEEYDGSSRMGLQIQSVGHIKEGKVLISDGFKERFESTFYAKLPNFVSYLNELFGYLGVEETLTLDKRVRESYDSAETIEKIKRNYQVVLESIQREEKGYLGGLLEGRHIKPRNFGVYLCTGLRKNSHNKNEGKMRVNVQGRKAHWNTVRGENHDLDMTTDYFLEDYGLVNVAQGGESILRTAIRELKSGGEAETFEELIALYRDYLGKKQGKLLKNSTIELNLETDRPYQIIKSYDGYAIIDNQSQLFMGIQDNRTNKEHTDTQEMLNGVKRLWEDLQ